MQRDHSGWINRINRINRINHINRINRINRILPASLKKIYKRDIWKI